MISDTENFFLEPINRKSCSYEISHNILMWFIIIQINICYEILYLQEQHE